MKGLIKSQFYSLRREVKLLLTVFLCLTAACILSSLVNVGETLVTEDNVYGMEVSGSLMFGLMAPDWCIYAELFILISAGLFASRDLNDKSVNYEIMFGHSRRDVYLSRVTVTMILGGAGGMLMFAASPAVSSLIAHGGWGDCIPLGTVLARSCKVFLLFCRLTAELIFLSALLKRTSLVYIAGVLIWVLEAVITSEAEGSRYVLLVTAGDGILNFNMFMRRHLDGSSELFFDAAFDTTVMATVAALYILITAGCLYFGYKAFARSDLE